MRARTAIVMVVAFTAMAVLFSNGSALGSIISDPAADFSITNGNPNGLWSYGWMDVGFTTFTLMPYGYLTGVGPDPSWGATTIGDRSPVIWVNEAGYTEYGVAPGQLSLQPGPQNQPAVVRWTAPASIVGQVTISGLFLPGDGGIMDVGVRLNNTTWLMQGTDSGTFNWTGSLSPGDTIDFDVYGGYNYGNTPLEATITFNVPEPASLSLLVLGGLTLLRRRK